MGGYVLHARNIVRRTGKEASCEGLAHAAREASALAATNRGNSGVKCKNLTYIGCSFVIRLARLWLSRRWHMKSWKSTSVIALTAHPKGSKWDSKIYWRHRKSEEVEVQQIKERPEQPF